MGKLVGVITSAVVGLALATGVSVAVTSASNPDKSVNLQEPASPNNVGARSGESVNYGSTP